MRHQVLHTGSRRSIENTKENFHLDITESYTESCILSNDTIRGSMESSREYLHVDIRCNRGVYHHPNNSKVMVL